MHRSGKVSVSAIAGLAILSLGLLGVGLFVDDVVLGIARHLPSSSALFTETPSTPIDTSMRDSGALEPTPYYNRQLGCRLRMPAGLGQPATSVHVDKSKRVAAFKAVNGERTFMVSMTDVPGESLDTAQRTVRDTITKDEPNAVVEDERKTEINGMPCRITTFGGINLKRVNFHVRNYLILAADGRLYSLWGIVRSASWSPEVFDAAASTFEVGTWTDEPVSQLPATPQSVTREPLTPQPIIPQTDTSIPPPAREPAIAPWPDELHGVVDLQVDDEWIPATVLGRINGQFKVRNLKTSEVLLVEQDHLRGRTLTSAPIPDPTRPQPPRTPQPHDTPATPRPRTPIREPDRPAAPPAPQTTDLSIDEAIVLLGSASESDQQKGAEALALITPDKDHKAGVVSKLSEVFRNKSAFTQPAAAAALAVWGDDALEKQFIDRLVTGKPQERPAIFEFLSHRKTAAAAKAIARRLRVSDDAGQADTLLRKMGDTAEPAVREMLTDSDKAVRARAIDILKEIGTSASVAALEKVTHDADAAVGSGAKLAIDAIKDRGN